MKKPVRPAGARPGYRIGAVARLTGISTHALRMWERRYGALAGGRSEGGNRLYSDVDVARLRTIRALTEYGHGIGQIARLPAQELEQLLAEQRAATAAPDAAAHALRDRFLAAIEAMDLPAAESVLSHALVALSPRDFAVEIVPDILAEVGARWAAQRICVAHEHAASALVRSQLGALLHACTPAADAPTVVWATLEGELHELGALLGALVAAMSGWRAYYLGPALPPSECARAVRQSAARAMALSVVVGDPDEVRAKLLEVERLLPRDVDLLVGGGAMRGASGLPARARVFTSLVDLEQFFRSARDA